MNTRTKAALELVTEKIDRLAEEVYSGASQPGAWKVKNITDATQGLRDALAADETILEPR